METSLDYTLLPIVRISGHDQLDLPGLRTAEPPRRAARSRSADRLAVYLTLTGNSPFGEGKQEQVLDLLVKTFYETSGSVTSALRTVADLLNQFLLERNLHNSSTGRQAVGLLSLLAIRDGQYYLAQSGPVHAFVITMGQTQHLYDPQTSGRGLGLSRTTSIRFYQGSLQPNDTLLLATQISPTWAPETLTGIHGQGPESLRRRLLNRAAQDLEGVLIQARPGTGKFQLVRSRPLPPTAMATGPDAAPVTSASSEPPASPPHAAVSTQPAPAVHPASPPKSAPPAPPLRPASSEQAVPAAQSTQEKGAVPSQPSGFPPQPAGLADEEFPEDEGLEGSFIPLDKDNVLAGEDELETPLVSNAVSESPAVNAARPAPRAAPPPPRRKPLAGPLFAALLAAVRPFARIFRRLQQSLAVLLARMLPARETAPDLAAIPSSTMAFIAIAVPVVVVTVASMVYLRQGLAMQAQSLYEQAQQSAVAAATQTDPAARRQAWNTVLGYLDQAESFQMTEQTRTLRRQAQTALDDLDLTRRVDYRPAIINGLPAGVKVTRIVNSEGDLYLLDGSSGNVLRALLTNQGYRTDTAFRCGPGEYNGQTVGALTDLAAWPAASDPQANVVAMDTAGIVLFCQASGDPQAVTLTPPPSLEWGSLAGFSLDQTDLYVLDPRSNAVWVYWAGKFTEQPQFFFAETVPPMKDVIDIAVNNGELYLLHEDGRLTLCYFSGLIVAPTQCTDPAPYIDARPGSEGAKFSPETPFSRILSIPPPDPSLFLLDPISQAIEHFSLRNLVFQRQYLPGRSLGRSPATAFAVNPIDRTLFLAIDNNVYYAAIP